MIGALTLVAALSLPAAPVDLSPDIVRQAAAEALTRPIWTTSVKRLAMPQWWPMHYGIFEDLDSTHDGLKLCRTPEAVAAGWRCQEGNPLAGGDTNAGRIAVSVGAAYGMALLVTWWENSESRKLGKPVRLSWWHELIMSTTVGSVRYAASRHNRGLEAKIRLDIGR